MCTGPSTGGPSGVWLYLRFPLELPRGRGDDARAGRRRELRNDPPAVPRVRPDLHRQITPPSMAERQMAPRLGKPLQPAHHSLHVSGLRCASCALSRLMRWRRRSTRGVNSSLLMYPRIAVDQAGHSALGPRELAAAGARPHRRGAGTGKVIFVARRRVI